MDIKDLRCFIVLAEALNFRQAAEKLHMSQPPLTRRIRQLERELGVSLFERTTRRVALTEAGQSLLSEARGLVLYADETARRIRHTTSKASNCLRIGYVPLALYTVLPEFLDQCRADFPHLELDLRERTTDMQLDELGSAAIDIGFVYTPIYSKLLATKSVYREPMKLAVLTTHPMANYAVAQLTDFASDIFIVHPRSENPAMYDDILRCCTTAGFSPRLLQKADDQCCMALLMAGQGIHFIASGMECLEPNGLEHLVIKGTVPTLELAIAWRQEDPSSIVKSLVNRISDI